MGFRLRDHKSTWLSTKKWKSNPQFKFLPCLHSFFLFSFFNDDEPLTSMESTLWCKLQRFTKLPTSSQCFQATFIVCEITQEMAWFLMHEDQLSKTKASLKVIFLFKLLSNCYIRGSVFVYKIKRTYFSFLSHYFFLPFKVSNS